MLFADIVGYTGLNEAHDPELVQALTSAAFDRLSAEVARYEGLVEKFAGDSMLVLFGVPQVHEDDAERAVRAALEMQSAIVDVSSASRGAGRPELSLRIGIESGEVLVDHARAASDRERIVTGDPVNTAARLQASANPGTVVVGPGTYASTRAVVEYGELGPLPIRGKALPVAAWRAIAVRSRRGGVRPHLGIESPLVGRDSEMALLKETVRRTAAEGRPHLLTIVGAAGVGKSRLTWELEKYLDGLPETYLWRKGRCLAYAQTSFGALAELIRSDASIREDDDPGRAAELLSARLEALPRQLQADDRALLAALLGLREVPEIPRDELFGALTRYIETLAMVAPAVFVVEDIHWADAALLDLIESTARWATGPIMLLCLTRHELLERRPAWAGGVPNAATIVLESLPATENARLIDGLAPGGIPPVLQSRIVELADGNPLFTEELVRMFIDRGALRFVDGRWQLAASVDELEVPGSVQAVLAARLDALPKGEKLLAQDAAVVGRVFWDAVLTYLAGERPARVDDLLRRLRVKDLVVPREPSSFSGAAEFSFRHVLIRDVAYESLPKLDRAEKHLAVARWAERELGDRSSELADLLGSHYLAAVRYREEFGAPAAELRPLRDDAFRFAVLARDRAARLHDKAGATRWARVALDLARAVELGVVERARAASAFLDYGSGYWQREEAAAVGDDALRLIARAARSSDLDAIEASIRSALAWVLIGMDRADDARAGLKDQLARLEAEPPTPARAQILARLGWLAWRTGPTDEARPYLERALAEARTVGSRQWEAWALHDLGVLTGQAGRVAESSELIRQSMEIARELGDWALMVRCYVNLPAMVLESGPDWVELEGWLDEGLGVVRRASDREAEAWLLWQFGDLSDHRGRLADAVNYRRQSAEIAAQHGDKVTAAARWLGTAWTEASRGRWAEADALLASVDLVRGEEQYRTWATLWRTWRQWRDDPASVRPLLVSLVFDNDLVASLWPARMAYRVGPRALLDQLGRVGAGRTDLASLTLRRWIAALAGPQSAAPAVLSLVIDELRRLGYRTLEATARVDLALALARAGEETAVAEADAIRLLDEIGMAPALGPMPEERFRDSPPEQLDDREMHTASVLPADN